MLVRKFPPLAGLLEKGVGEMALGKVTGGSRSTGADEKAFKSVRIPNSEQQSFTNLCQAGWFFLVFWVFFFFAFQAAPHPHPPPPPGRHLRPLPPLFQRPAAQKETLTAMLPREHPHLPFVPRKPPPSPRRPRGSPSDPLYLPRLQINSVACQKFRV